MVGPCGVQNSRLANSGIGHHRMTGIGHHRMTGIGDHGMTVQVPGSSALAVKKGLAGRIMISSIQAASARAVEEGRGSSGSRARGRKTRTSGS